MREYTHRAAAAPALGSDGLLRKTLEARRHVSWRPDLSLSVGLDAQVQGLAKFIRRGAGRSCCSSPRLLGVSESKNLTAESHEQKKNDPSTTYKKPVSILHE